RPLRGNARPDAGDDPQPALLPAVDGGPARRDRRRRAGGVHRALLRGPRRAGLRAGEGAAHARGGAACRATAEQVSLRQRWVASNAVTARGVLGPRPSPPAPQPPAVAVA